MADPSSAAIRLSDILSRHQRPVEVIAEMQYEQVGIRSFGRGFFLKPLVGGADLGNKKIFRIEEGDLVFNIVFAWEGAVALAGLAEHDKVASHRFPTYRADAEVADHRFLLAFFMSAFGNELLQRHSPGSAGRNRTLNQKGLLSEEIHLPPLEKQNQVAEVLQALHQARRMLDTRHQKLEAMRHGLADELFSASVRLPLSYDRFLVDEVELGVAAAAASES